MRPYPLKKLSPRPNLTYLIYFPQKNLGGFPSPQGAIHLRAEISGQARIYVSRPKFQAKILAWRQEFWPGQKYRLADE